MRWSRALTEPSSAAYWRLVLLSDNSGEMEVLMTVILTRPERAPSDDPRAGSALAWGRRYAMVRPEHFRIDYVINPYMDLGCQPDAVTAMAQWQHLVATLE